MWNLKTPDSQTQKVAHLFRLVKKVVNFRDRLYMRRLYFNKTECVQISRHQIPKCQMVSIFRTTALGTLGENVFVYSDWKFYTTHINTTGIFRSKPFMYYIHIRHFKEKTNRNLHFIFAQCAGGGPVKLSRDKLKLTKVKMALRRHNYNYYVSRKLLGKPL